MTDMSRHSEHYAAGAPLRRARVAAWTVFLSMAGTTMAFQVFHSIKYGAMPWPLAALYGTVPLLISICILEIVAEWTGAPWWAKTAAYAIMGGSMFMSASATGDIVLHAAPAHMSLLFGFLLDAAALLAVHFILNGPAAAHAVAAVDRKVAELHTAVAAERSAREHAEVAHRARVCELEAQADADLAASAAGHEAELNLVRTELTGALDAEREVRENLETSLAGARSDAEAATARAERLERKLGGPRRRSAGSTARTGTGPKGSTGTGGGTAPDDDLDLEARALKLLATDLDMSGAELARQLGVTEGYGRKLRRRLTGDRPADEDRDRPEDRAGTAPADRPEDRG